MTIFNFLIKKDVANWYSLHVTYGSPLRRHLKLSYLQVELSGRQSDVFFLVFLRVALTGPRSEAIYRLHPCSHWPLFAIAPTHDWIY